jgi:hypothetical protein
MSAIGASGRRWPALNQEEVLAAAARVALGGGAGARDLVEAAYENPTGFWAQHLPALRRASLPFDSDRWNEMPV